ncbi:MAG: peptidase domain-containing ABC transporter, partial [bacterium]|nr:peptidase domain-containing ABC transporter [bacterium]
SAVLDFVMLFVYLGLMFYYQAELTAVALIFIPLSMGLTLIYTPILKSISRRAFLARAEQSSVLIDSLRGIDVVKTEAVERPIRWQWEERFTKEMRIGFYRMKMQMLFGSASNLVNVLSNTVILWYGATLVMDGQLSVGQLMAFTALIGNVMGPIMGLIGLWPQVQEARIALDRLNDIFDTPMETSRHGDYAVSLGKIEGRIEFDKVFFRYGVGSEEPFVLNSICLTIEPGQKVAIVGRSGAGKTTLVKMVSRLFDPSEGRVMLDGIDVQDFHPGWLRQQIGMVLQEPFLFSGTIAENIALGAEDIEMDQVVKVARLANVHEVVADLPMGYETKVGEQGVGLSGGQRQRIVIARALYHNPRILIFDEATNALDTESEQAIQENLDEILHDRTALIIAHRLSTVRDADVIVVLDKGHIAEMGDHDHLMLQQGLYYHLSSQQLTVV